MKPLHAFFSLDKQPRIPWKNGAGLTQELATWPPETNTDAWEMRVSVAEFAIDVPFSVFPGIDRHMTLLSDAGLTLDSQTFETEVFTARLSHRWQSIRFKGELALRATLHGQVVSVLNVMTKRSLCTSRVEIHHDAFQLDGIGNGVLLNLQGQSACKGQVQDTPLQFLLGPNEGLWWACHPRTARCQVIPSSGACVCIVFEALA